MSRYRVRVPVQTEVVFEVVADTPQHAQGKVAALLQMGLDERLGFVRMEPGRTTAPSSEWEAMEVPDVWRS